MFTVNRRFYICLHNLCFLYQYTKYPFFHILTHQHLILSNLTLNRMMINRVMIITIFLWISLITSVAGYLFMIIGHLYFLCYELIVHILCPFFFWILSFSSWFVGVLTFCILNLCYICCHYALSFPYMSFNFMFSFIMSKLFILTSNLSIYSCICFLHVLCLNSFLLPNRDKKASFKLTALSKLLSS